MSGFIFCNKDGIIHKPSVINSAIKRIYEAYNAEEIIKAKRESRRPVLIPHFRVIISDTFCTRFCENERNLKVIQSIMGHANIETTMDIYAEATDVKKRKQLKLWKIIVIYFRKKSLQGTISKTNLTSKSQNTSK